VISQFLAAGLVDEVMITTAPLWLGGLRAVEAEPGGRLELTEPAYAQLGADLITWGRLASVEGEA
jgi:riboflavin biosynthesis pyrimidine reductase